MQVPRTIPRIRAVERKLGRELAVGLCWQGTGLVEVDPRLPSKQYMDTLIHEMLHHFFEDMTEEDVERVAHEMTDVLWKKNFRRLRD